MRRYVGVGDNAIQLDRRVQFAIRREDTGSSGAVLPDRRQFGTEVHALKADTAHHPHLGYYWVELRPKRTKAQQASGRPGEASRQNHGVENGSAFS